MNIEKVRSKKKNQDGRTNPSVSISKVNKICNLK